MSLIKKNANIHKLRALGTISHKIYKKTQKYTEVSEMIRSIRNVLKNSSVHQNSAKGTGKVIKNEVITDRQTDRQTDCVHATNN